MYIWEWIGEIEKITEDNSDNLRSALERLNEWAQAKLENETRGYVDYSCPEWGLLVSIDKTTSQILSVLDSGFVEGLRRQIAHRVMYVILTELGYDKYLVLRVTHKSIELVVKSAWTIRSAQHHRLEEVLKYVTAFAGV